MKFLLELILERSDDSELQEVTLMSCNKHNDTILTLLLKNHEVFRDSRQTYFKIFRLSILFQ